MSYSAARRLCCRLVTRVRRPEARIALPEGALERAVQRRRADVEEGLHGGPVPAHLLLLGHPLGHDLVDRALHEGGRDRLATPAPGGVGHQGVLVALEVAQQVADAALEAANAGQVTSGLAPRPAAQAREIGRAHV